MAASAILNELIKHSTKSNSIKLLAAISAYLLFKYRGHAVGTHARRDLKEPKGAIPFLGHMFLMLSIPSTQIYDFCVRNHEELGPVWSISMPFIGRMIQADRPENVEHVLKNNFWNYQKGPMVRETFGDLFGGGIFAADGNEWKFQRKLASHIFNVKAFKEYTSDVFVIEGQRVVDYLLKAADEGTIVDLHELFLKFTLDSFGTFGCLENMDEEVEFATSFDDLATICSERMNGPGWRLREWLTGVAKKAASDKEIIGKYARSIIEKRRREGFHGANKDLLQLFLDTKDEDGKPLTDDFIADIILNFTIAGRDTTAQALSWMFYLLCRDEADPQLKKDLFKEVDEVLQGQNPTYESHKSLKFAEACFYEGLRLYPSVPRNFRQCLADDVLPDGTKVHKGDWFAWSSYVMGRSEHVWGPDAKEYKPSRWINTERPSQGKFSSFHAGPRVCLGQQFATIEGLTMMSMILSKLDIELVEPDKVPAHAFSVTMPMLNGLPVRLRRRDISSINLAREV
ncbi:hypothetical protein BGZ49_003135 [Haplosporangium sp. Z 27]|nr:hypothetical protein BGZ49_003135 [Haplosporangium sp. Z 27]